MQAAACIGCKPCRRGLSGLEALQNLATVASTAATINNAATESRNLDLEAAMRLYNQLLILHWPGWRMSRSSGDPCSAWSLHGSTALVLYESYAISRSWVTHLLDFLQRLAHCSAGHRTNTDV
jgi:hypothetical protein